MITLAALYFSYPLDLIFEEVPFVARICPPKNENKKESVVDITSFGQTNRLKEKLM